MIEAVLFDWGGTLDDGAWDEEVALRANRAGLEAIGRPDIGAQAVSDWFAENEDAFRLESTDEVDLTQIMSTCLRSLGCPVTGEELESYTHAWQGVVSAEARVHPDVQRLLGELRSRGLRTGLVSNTSAPGRFLRPRLEENGLADAFDVVVFSSDHGKRKPHGTIFESALNRLGVAPERALFVGDRLDTDIAGARGAGMKTAQAAWFRAEKPESDGLPDYVLREPLEVLDILGRCLSTSRS